MKAIRFSELEPQTLAHMAITRNEKLTRSRLRQWKADRERHHVCADEIKMASVNGPQTWCPVCGTVLKSVYDFMP